MRAFIQTHAGKYSSHGVEGVAGEIAARASGRRGDQHVAPAAGEILTAWRHGGPLCHALFGANIVTRGKPKIQKLDDLRTKPLVLLVGESNGHAAIQVVTLENLSATIESLMDADGIGTPILYIEGEHEQIFSLAQSMSQECGCTSSKCNAEIRLTVYSPSASMIEGIMRSTQAPSEQLAPENSTPAPKARRGKEHFHNDPKGRRGTSAGRQAAQ